MKYISMILILILIPISFLHPSEADEISAKITNISGRKYFDALIEVIKNAEKRIDVVMYLVRFNPLKQNSKVGKVLDALIDANKRGVIVNVILDRNVNYSRKIHHGVEGKNIWAYEKLKKAGVDVFYDDKYKLTHSKVVVVDEKIVILGSTNWSDAAFDKNVEMSFLVQSVDLAKELLSSFKGLKDETKDYPFKEKYSLKVPLKFIESRELGSRMITKHDERAFDVYLFLLKEISKKYLPQIHTEKHRWDGAGKERKDTRSNLATEDTESFDSLRSLRINKKQKHNELIKLDYERIAKELGIYKKDKKWKYRKAINKVLKKLKDVYGLINYELKHSGDAEVVLLNINNNAEVEEDYFLIPFDYWEYGFSGKLSFREKYCYMINLYYLSVADIPPLWTETRKTITDKFGVHSWLISKGMIELRRKNLIDILYRAPESEGYSYSYPNTYIVLPLYDPIKLNVEFKKIEKDYGKDLLRKAKKYAHIVFKDNDVDVIEDIIGMINSYGNKIVSDAFKIVKKKHTSNPRRSYGYVKGIVKNVKGNKK
ncbi:MAG: hypothetical protein KAI43_14015 [Candidatus Aureabacteria bacterium]|nr:hypothetical protein [Candidatus Auribacterota bacterium]